MRIRIEEDFIFEMANVRGKTVKVPHKLDFSFVFTVKDCVASTDIQHGLRVKPVFNPERINTEDEGTLKLFGDWEYKPGRNDKNVSTKQIKEMKDFFTTYKILFAAVWEKVLQQDVVQDYFKGNLTLNEVIEEFDFYNDYKEELDMITDLEELQEFVEKNNLFNTWNK